MRFRDRALFDFAIDTKLRGCDVVKVRIGDIVTGGQARIESTVRYLGADVEDALELSERTEV